MTKKKTETDEMLEGVFDSSARQKTFDATVSVDGVTRTGTFTVQFMNVSQRIKMGELMSEMLHGKQLADVDPFTADLVYMTAFLETTLVAKPKWWDAEKLDYESDLTDIFKIADEFQQSFRRKNDKSSDAGTGENS